MAQTIELKAEPRTDTGKGAARRARASHKVPAVIYGRGREPQPLLVDSTALDMALRGIDIASTLIQLDINGKAVRTLIRELQRHPTRLDIEHVDFYEIHTGEKIRLSVAIHLTGTPDGVRNGGGVLDQVLRDVEIEVLPRHIPERVEIVVEDLIVGKSLQVQDLEIPNAKILTDPGVTICSVIPPRVEEPEAAEVVEEEELAEPEVITEAKAAGEEEAGESAE